MFGKEQYLVPYLMSSHPGSTLDDAIELALRIKRDGVDPEQVQDFYPTPGTASTVMYYTGIDPFTGKLVYVPDEEEKRLQRALLQPTRPQNARHVREALRRAGREDLIGYGKECLIRPEKEESFGGKGGKGGYGGNGGKNVARGGKPTSKNGKNPRANDRRDNNDKRGKNPYDKKQNPKTNTKTNAKKRGR